MRPLLLLPEILLFTGGLVVLLSGSFLARDRQWVSGLLAAAALVGTVVAAAVELSGPAQMAMEGTFTVDVTTGVVRVVAALGTLVVLALASDEIRGSQREGMIDLTDSLCKLIENGWVDPKDAYPMAPNTEELKMALKGIRTTAGGIL